MGCGGVPPSQAWDRQLTHHGAWLGACMVMAGCLHGPIRLLQLPNDLLQLPDLRHTHTCQSPAQPTSAGLCTVRPCARSIPLRLPHAMPRCHPLAQLALHRLQAAHGILRNLEVGSLEATDRIGGGTGGPQEGIEGEVGAGTGGEGASGAPCALSMPCACCRR